MNKKQSFWVIAVFFIALLISMIVSLPARHILRFVEIPADIKIYGLNGSIINGRIEIIRYQQFSLSDVDFKFQPLCLFTVGLCYQIVSDDKDLELNIDANLLTQNMSITHSQISLDSTILKDIPQLLVQPKGQFVVSIESLTFIDSKISDLVAELDWLGAGVQGEDQLLGNYNAVITQEPDKLKINLSDKDSLLSVTGGVDVKWNGQFNVDVKFESKPDLNKSVKSVMEMTTKKSGLNRFSLKKSGNLSADSLKLLQFFKSSS